MRPFIFLIIWLLFLINPAQARQEAVVKGKVVSGKNALAAATVGIREINLGTSTDEDGKFLLDDIPVGEYELFISSVGYQTEFIQIALQKNDTLDLVVELSETVNEMEQLVVTGTMTKIALKESPVKTVRISNQVLQQSGSQNIMDAVNYIAGINKQVDCAVCGTSSIRINGMEGPYTAVLIDGMPVIGALASVYSLSGISSDLIQSIEIIKGPNSTLYGSSAMGGVINIITKDPALSPLLSAHINANTHAEQNYNFIFAPEMKQGNTLISSNLFFSPSYVDENEDGFSDFSQDNRFTLFTKWEKTRSDFTTTSIATKLYLEDRLGGLKDYTHQIRGSDQIYGESIYTKRYEFLGRHEWLSNDASLRLDLSYSYHDQDSYYGTYKYDAQQQTIYSNLLFATPVFDGANFLTGLVLRYDHLRQLFNFTEVDGSSNSECLNPGVLAQFDYRLNDQWRLLAGYRIDYYKDHGYINSPRLNLKYSPDSHTTIRLNTGTGFRLVNLFTEEHQALTGSRQVEVAEALNPERSVNITLNVNRIIDIRSSVLNLDMDFFYTRFSNKIIPDYSTPDKIIYSNSPGYSVSKGISINLAHNFIAPLTYMIGFTLQDVFLKDHSTKKDLLFAPDYSAVFSLSYTFNNSDLTLDYTGRLLGPMPLPDYPGRNRFSNHFTEQNIKFTKTFKRFDLYLSVQNLFNYSQKNPIIAADKPFSPEFATDYVYAPIQGRRFMIGLRTDILK